MDFGVARLTDAAALTAPGDVVGTLAYMAPEQAEGRAAGPEADVYSLALMLYECWTGENPHRPRDPRRDGAGDRRPRPAAAPRPPRPAPRAERDGRRLPAAAPARAAPRWRSWAERSRTRSSGWPTLRPGYAHPHVAAPRRVAAAAACSASGSPPVTASASMSGSQINRAWTI